MIDREIKLTKKELMDKLALIKPKDKDQRNKLVCTLIGHSLINTICFGYRNCGRCGDLLGDSLGSIDPAAKFAVIVGHNCKECRANYKRCTWRDKLYCPNPFKKINK